MKNKKNIVLGIILIALGIIFGGNALNLFNINVFFKGWWTLFIIIPCFIGLITDEDKIGSLVGILIGITLFLGANDIVSYDLLWKLAIPVILVVIGICIIFKDIFNKEVNEEIKKINNGKNDENVFAAFSGQDVNFNDKEFNGKDLTAVFGGIKCDLSSCILKKDVVINANAIFGGIDIIVPKDVTVVIKSTSIFGGTGDKRVAKAETKGHTIYINATCLFGGVDVK